MEFYHTSVLLRETIEALQVESDKKYIDGTLGGGGHTRAILEEGGIVLGIDVDSEALSHVEKELQSANPELLKKLILAKGNFRDIATIARENKCEDVSGILFDLGVSSHQIDSAERGFSFQKDGPLDMRMDKDLKIKANDLVNILTKAELYELFTRLGEERFAKAIIRGIVKSRQIKPIETTIELSRIITQAVPIKNAKINPSTRVFQALRIAVNDELSAIREALPNALSVLANKGRIAVISFHSLEDRIIKTQFNEWEEQGLGRNVTKKPIIPSEEEMKVNRRSRSAKLRIFEKGTYEKTTNSD